MNRCTMLLALALTIGLILPGCGGKKAETPKEALKLMGEALESKDKSQFMAVVHCGEDEEFCELMFEAASEMMDFIEAMQEAYPDEKGTNMDSPLPTPEQIDKMEVTEDGDTATAKNPDGKDIELVKRDGAWMVDMTAEMPKPEEAEAEKKKARAMIEAVKEVKGEIGKEGSNPMSIMMKLAATAQEKMKAANGD